MIKTSANSFYVIRAIGQAAELITSVFSPSSMTDIVNVDILSREFSNDIEPINELDSSIDAIKEGIHSPINETIKFNPLFFPSQIEDLDDALDVEHKSEMVGFSAMNGNPFAIKMIELTSSDEAIIQAMVSYNQFDLPSYEVIMKSREQRLN